MLLLAAGPCGQHQLVLLRLCEDAMRATAVLTPTELARLSAAVDAVAELAHAQRVMRQVRFQSCLSGLISLGSLACQC